LTDETAVRRARQLAWPALQRILIGPEIDELLRYTAAVSQVVEGSQDGVDYCREKLALAPGELNPTPLITGDDLKRAGIRPGPDYRRILDAVRDAQLEKRITTGPAALEMARTLCQSE
jgi:hypothetical protein